MNYIVELQKALDYIEDNLEEDINYEKIAKELGISSFYFHRIFSSIIGTVMKVLQEHLPSFIMLLLKWLKWMEQN